MLSIKFLLQTSCPIRLRTGLYLMKKIRHNLNLEIKLQLKYKNLIIRCRYWTYSMQKCLQPYCLCICSTNYMGSMESTFKLWWQIIIEFDAKYQRQNNSISDPNEHHPLVNVNVDRLLCMLRTIHHRRFVEIAMKSVQEH